jgi:cysteine synthase
MYMNESTILDSIGNTPLIELQQLSPKPGVRLFAKLEGHNPTGSIKDRVAKAIVEEAEREGFIHPGMTLVEASTGNMALSLALVAKQKGYNLTVVVPPNIAPFLEDLIRLVGARIVSEPLRAGMLGPIEQAQRLSRENGYYATRQFESRANLDTHYRITGQEIVDALPDIDAFVAGIGTGGTLTGIGRRLKERNKDCFVVGVTPSLGENIQGIRSLEEGYEPPLLDMSLLDSRFLVDSAASFAAARLVFQMTGLMVGISSGAVFHAGLRIAKRLHKGNIVLLFADNGWRYTSGLLGIEPQLIVKDDLEKKIWW